MNSETFKDNNSYDKDSLNSIPSITNALTNKTLEQLDKDGLFVFPNNVADADDLTKEQMVLQLVNDKYITSNVMGFLGCGDEQLIIQSRFDKNYLFYYLLDKVLDIPNILDFRTETSGVNGIFDLLLFMFPYYLKNAMRKGLYKTYINHLYDDANIKGPVDVPRHIKNNVPFVGKFAYTVREHSYDNYLMELVRHTIEYIKRKPFGNKILSSVKNEVEQVVFTTKSYRYFDERKIIQLNRKNIVRHAYFYEYRELQKLCLLILQNSKNKLGSGSQGIYGILFDGAWLWEEYVNLLINDNFYHPMNKAGSGRQYLFSNKTGVIYPDFISKNKNSESRIIADAKYKPASNIGNKDYLQVLAYMFRFDAKKGYYIYPKVDNGQENELHLCSGTSYENNLSPRDDIFVKKLGITIPNEDSYNNFIEAMAKNESEFKGRLFN